MKFVADRFESPSVRHPRKRSSRRRPKMAVTKPTAKSVALEIDDLTGIGPYSVYPRTSARSSCNQIFNLTGAPYVIPSYRARGDGSFSRTRM